MTECPREMGRRSSSEGKPHTHTEGVGDRSAAKVTSGPRGTVHVLMKSSDGGGPGMVEPTLKFGRNLSHGLINQHSRRASHAPGTAPAHGVN